ncbi:hypothetical protein B0H63DRAFT_524601 [Podospora didyma]|uniref:Uncharacterized protein n=1 Tax=Podospora didyma TaxID=330526 RepID=A0AAE0TWD9_9PEZI|nr:hypothetical protein B0H63DRAFT_524601 [Podospora didyma]
MSDLPEQPAKDPRRFQRNPRAGGAERLYRGVLGDAQIIRTMFEASTGQEDHRPQIGEGGDDTTPSAPFAATEDTADHTAADNFGWPDTISETRAPFTIFQALMNGYCVSELNVQNGVLKSLSFLFEYIGEMAKDYVYAVTPCSLSLSVSTICFVRQCGQPYFDIQSTGQESYCVNIAFQPSPNEAKEAWKFEGGT